MGSKRVDLGPERADLGPERVDLRLKESLSSLGKGMCRWNYVRTNAGPANIWMDRRTDI